jgi:hypothetical protein
VARVIDLIKGVIYLAFAGYFALNGAIVFLGFGKDISITVKDHFNTKNAKVIVLDVQNTSKWWTKYALMGNAVSVYSHDFEASDENNNILEIDGRSHASAYDLREGKHKNLELVFVDENDNIDSFKYLDIYSKNNHVEKNIPLPEADYVKTDEELLQDALFSSGEAQDKAVNEVRARIESSLKAK